MCDIRLIIDPIKQPSRACVPEARAEGPRLRNAQPTLQTLGGYMCDIRLIHVFLVGFRWKHV